MSGSTRPVDPPVGQDAAQRIHLLESELAELVQRAKRLIVDLSTRFTLTDEAIQHDRRQLLEANAQRIQEFERRLALEWDALRQVHEESLAAATTPPETHSPATGAASGGQAAPSSADAGRSWRGSTPWLAACIALAAYTGYVHWRSATVMREMAARLEAIDRRSAESRGIAEKGRLVDLDAQRATSDAFVSATQTARMLQVIAAPDTRRLDLRGGPGAPGAAGQALWSRARGIVISASGLPAPTATETYQVWLLTSRGPISLGFLHADARGRVSTAFDMPDDLPGTIAGLSVTREAAGGSGRPSGPIALASKV
jgi:hypothetical protein